MGGWLSNLFFPHSQAEMSNLVEWSHAKYWLSTSKEAGSRDIGRELQEECTATVRCVSCNVERAFLERHAEHFHFIHEPTSPGACISDVDLEKHARPEIGSILFDAFEEAQHGRGPLCCDVPVWQRNR